jgi:hypothetical protein
VSLLRWFQRIYIFTFYVMYRCATTRFGSQEWGEQNAVFAMSLLQYMLLTELICGIALLTGHTPIIVPKLMVLFGAAVLLMLTYFPLVRKHQWLPFKAEFERYPRGKHFLASLGVGILMAAAFLGVTIVKKAIGTVH